MKKFLMMFLSLILFCGCTLHKKPQETSAIDILTLFQSQSNAQNKLWVGTMQLAFNEVKENIIKGDVYFVNEKPTFDLIGLNQNLFNKDMLNEKSYYTSWGKTTFKQRDLIKKDIKKKFNTNSDILDLLDWSEEEGKYFAYAMLKKDFEFFTPFDKLDKLSFNNSKEKYAFFGINDKSKEELRKAVRVLFYNNNNDFAIQLPTKTNDLVYLYRTDSDKDFEKIYKKMIKDSNNYTGNQDFADKDTLKVPNLKIKQMRKYPELCNKTIIGTDFYFSDVIETIDLTFDERGGKIKSEAAILVKTNSLIMADNDKPRNFDFDKTYVMFLVDEGKTDPYFAIRVKDLKDLQ